MSDRFARYPKPPKGQKVGGRPRPPAARKKPAFPKGPRWLQEVRRGPKIDGFGPPPPGFTTGQTSDPEWLVYAALAAIFGLPKDPRIPPYLGGPPIWQYQKMVQGGKQLGGSNLDFVVDQLGELFIFRIQSLRYHVSVPSAKHAYDVLQEMRLSRVGGKPARVVDLYEQDFLRKDPGQAAAATVKVVKRALAGIEDTGPVPSGTAVRRITG